MKIKLTENELKHESVKNVLKESEDFKPNGYKVTSAFGGYEMQVDNRGEMARLRNSYNGTVSEWFEIQFDEDGGAYVIDENGDEERHCDYMRY